MSPERWNKVREIFLSTADLPAEEAAEFLERACEGDRALALEVESLLESEREPVNRIEAAVSNGAAAYSLEHQEQALSTELGRRIGPYKVVQLLGVGGMGSVYQAVRVDDQYRRSVAIKLITHGIAAPGALARFRSERQILATLQHPNIAALLDGGTTDDGLPYIVMEYIEGESIVSYCRRKNPSIAERLELFRAVCAAVQHAHQMLVIHRDIKPANVLVTPDGIPKLLDFGIAKLLAPEPAVDEFKTETVMRILTPHYASPEQVRGEPLGTTSDIYSLGVLLYEMLTFRSPYNVTGTGEHAIERAVCENEPLRLSEAAKGDKRLRRQLAGDLERIAAMALRKEPQRRYTSAREFAADVQRYLQGQPVMARPETMLYVARKFVRRNKAATLAGVLLAISIAAGWTATIRESHRTARRFEEVRKLANAVLFDLHGRMAHLPGATPVREYLVQTALKYLNSLAQDAGDDLSLRWDLAQAYEQVGDVQGNPSGPNLGHLSDALRNYNTALSMAEVVTHGNREPEKLIRVAGLYYKCGELEVRLGEAERGTSHFQQGISMAQSLMDASPGAETAYALWKGYDGLANVQLRLRQTTEALQSAEKAASVADTSERQWPRARLPAPAARTRVLLGDILWLKGDLIGASRDYDEAVRRLEHESATRMARSGLVQDLIDAYRRAGDLQANPAYFHFDDVKRAEYYHRKGLALAQQVALRDPEDAQAQWQLSTAQRRLGVVLRESNPAESITQYRLAQAILDHLLATSPGDFNWRRDLANTHLGLATPLAILKKDHEALSEAEIALAMQRDLLRQHPTRSVIFEDMLDTQLALGRVHLNLRQLNRALPALNEALRVANTLKASESDLYAERCLALAYQALGEYHATVSKIEAGARRAEHVDQAKNFYAEALGIWTRWRRLNLAIPYSATREKEVLRLTAQCCRP